MPGRRSVWQWTNARILHGTFRINRDSLVNCRFSDGVVKRSRSRLANPEE
ncbi:hypothetical protein DESC_320031 [Desulfosarcina cetonica]|nr:hypothetical protein DESC_320031 [Desulfosarcina cetonica]